MISEPAGSEPGRRKGPGCLLIVALVVVGLIIAILVFAFARPTDEQKVAQCPDVTRALIEEQLGATTSFQTTENNPGNQMKGTATVRGFVYEWICGIGIARGNSVQVEVRDADNTTVISEYVDL